MRIDVPMRRNVDENRAIVVPGLIAQAMKLRGGETVERRSIDAEEGEVICTMRVVRERPQKKLL